MLADKFISQISQLFDEISQFAKDKNVILVKNGNVDPKSWENALNWIK